MRRFIFCIVMLMVASFSLTGCGAKSKLAAKDAEIMSLQGEMGSLESRLRQTEGERDDALARGPLSTPQRREAGAV